jgi:hypothetical protein
MRCALFSEQQIGQPSRRRTLPRHCLTPADYSTEPSPDAASTLLDPYRVFNPVAQVRVEPTSIDRPVAGRWASVVRNDSPASTEFYYPNHTESQVY